MSRMVTLSNGTQEWRNEAGDLHRLDGPAVIQYYGTQEWWQNGEPHRVDGPAVICPNGTQMWYQNGVYHRDNGPAVTYADGTQEWFRNGERHHDDGPAYIDADGTHEWWQNDQPLNHSMFEGEPIYLSVVPLTKIIGRSGVRKVNIKAAIDEKPCHAYRLSKEAATLFHLHF